MLHTIHVRNVHCTLPVALRDLDMHGIPRSSRVGPVMMFPGPVVTIYDKPAERVMFWPQRDANPFFHLFESLWMLAGRNDLASLTPFVARMADYSDDGVTLHGAYGYRWRCLYDDQLSIIMKRLRNNPDDRRCVLQMWNTVSDLDYNYKDVPCNTMAFVSINSTGALDLSILNRSNDMIWGAYGSNAVHFSMLQEYLALGIGVDVGTMYQFSNNMHAYENVLVEPLTDLKSCVGINDPYTMSEVSSFPLIQPDESIDDFDADLDKLFLFSYLDLDDLDLDYTTLYFRRVVVPLLRAHKAWKTRAPMVHSVELAEDCLASDWRLAAVEWLHRRYASKTTGQ